MSTFLLEMALDRARVKERLAAALLAERTRRGHGDPRQFPQPEMARELGYSLRQYQRLEDAAHPNLPSWNQLEAIAERLEIDTAALFGSDEDITEPADDRDADRVAQLEAEMRETQQALAVLPDVQAALARIEALLRGQADAAQSS